MKYLFSIVLALAIFSCKENPNKLDISSQNNVVEPFNIDSLRNEGFQIFAYFDDKLGDSVYMQEYFMAFLKSGENRTNNKKEIDSIQKLHRAHLGKMYDLGYADISGPFGDNGDIRGITIYNTPTLEFADSLANLDPMVQSGRLKIEIHPWWAGKGFGLR